MLVRVHIHKRRFRNALMTAFRNATSWYLFLNVRFLFSNSRLSDSRLSNSRLLDSRLSSSRLSDSRLSNSRLSNSRLLRVAGLRVAGLRVAGLRIAGLRVAGLRVAGVWGWGGLLFVVTVFLYFAVLGVTAMTVKWGTNKRTIVSYFLLSLL